MAESLHKGDGQAPSRQVEMKDDQMIPVRFAPILFGLILSGLMSAMVSGIATWRAVGMNSGFAAHWLGTWLISWAVAFPAVLIVAPITRRIVAQLTRA
jgi:hypothetical protein